MKYFRFSVILLIILASCKKETIDKPVNESQVDNTGCETCPSHFYTITDVIPAETICDDFTDDVAWPDGFFGEESFVGNSQNGEYPINVGSGGFCEFSAGNPGMYGSGGILFEFSGDQQTIRYEIYGFEGQYPEMSFSFDGISYYNLFIGEFPMEIDGILVELDTSIPDSPPDWLNSHLTFTGEISMIELNLFESGVIELCVTNEGESPVIDKTGPVYFDNFFDHSGTITGTYPNTKTPFGYFGLQGANLSIDFNDFLGYSPTKVGFVHAYTPTEEEHLVNVQLPGTPLIVTIIDSLDFHLAPYGYKIEKYNYEGILWENMISTSDAMVDSVLIKGNNINQLKIGVAMEASEFRSICTYYE